MPISPHTLVRGKPRTIILATCSAFISTCLFTLCYLPAVATGARHGLDGSVDLLDGGAGHGANQPLITVRPHPAASGSAHDSSPLSETGRSAVLGFVILPSLISILNTAARSANVARPSNDACLNNCSSVALRGRPNLCSGARHSFVHLSSLNISAQRRHRYARTRSSTPPPRFTVSRLAYASTT
jgi:hypothetical protein